MRGWEQICPHCLPEPVAGETETEPGAPDDSEDAIEAPAAQYIVLESSFASHGGGLVCMGLILVRARRQRAVGGDDYMSALACFMLSQWLP